MNASERIAAAELEFKVGQQVTIPFYPNNIEHVLEDGEYVILDARDLSVYDVADGWETAESMAYELAEGQGYIAVLVNADGQHVQQGWRDEVADCWGLES